MKIFTDIIVTPEVHNHSGCFQGGPIWPDWELQNDFRHNRGDLPADIKPLEPDSVNKIVDENLFWCGIIHPHFGHQISEFILRCINYLDLDGKFCFSVHSSLKNKVKSFDTTPKFFQDMIILLKIDPNRIFIVTEPILAKKLFCSKQPENLNSKYEPEDNFLSKLNSLIPSKSQKNGTYYISRAGMKSGKIAGEMAIEAYLSTQNVKVIRPETISFKEQMRLYGEAEHLIFSEGSAIHSLQFFGYLNTKVTVLSRRDNSRFGEVFLTKRVKELRYYTLGKNYPGVISNGSHGINIPKIRNLLDMFKDLNFDIYKFNLESFLISCKDDIAQWCDYMDKFATRRKEDHLVGKFKNMITRDMIDNFTEPTLGLDDLVVLKSAALSVESNNIFLAYDLMLLARKIRPNGKLINQKISDYKNKIGHKNNE